MKLYGSLTNRFEESKQYCKEIEVGTYMTEYMWSDRHAYEVVKVIDQQHVSVRRLKAIRTDNYGMSDAQNYRYESDERQPVEDLEFRRGKWYKVYYYNKESILKTIEERFNTGRNIMRKKEHEYNWLVIHAGMTANQRAKFENGATIKKYTQWNNISFGVADEYYDFSF